MKDIMTSTYNTALGLQKLTSMIEVCDLLFGKEATDSVIHNILSSNGIVSEQPDVGCKQEQPTDKSAVYSFPNIIAFPSKNAAQFDDSEFEMNKRLYDEEVTFTPPISLNPVQTPDSNSPDEASATLTIHLTGPRSEVEDLLLHLRESSENTIDEIKGPGTKSSISMNLYFLQ